MWCYAVWSLDRNDETSLRTSLFFDRKFNESTLKKRHIGDSHFLAVNDGYVRGAHALILHSCWIGKMPLRVLSCSLRYDRPVLINFGTFYVI